MSQEEPKPIQTDQVTQCQKFLDHTLPQSKKIKKLLEEMTNMKCNFQMRNIKCEPCTTLENYNGGYIVDFTKDEDSPQRNEILLCDNKLKTPTEVENVLIHEMIHAYDDCRAYINPDDCLHFACMEIRASYNSGECYYIQEVRRGHYGLIAGTAQCARRRATLSLKMSEKCGKDAEMWINKAWKFCAKDREPFE